MLNESEFRIDQMRSSAAQRRAEEAVSWALEHMDEEPKDISDIVDIAGTHQIKVFSLEACVEKAERKGMT